MKLIEWNCQGAFRKKNENILSFKPDILIIPECENGEKLKFGKLTPKPNDFFWYGDNENKGIGIFSYSDCKFELMREFNPKFRYIVPLKVTKNDISFLLFAIWAMDNKENYEARYIGQIWLAINYYSDLFRNDTIIIGDFNSNKIWDYIDRVGNHTSVVDFLKNKRIESLYHTKNQEEQGNEKILTFYLYRNLEKSYHIDYCFVSEQIIKNGYDITILNINDWIKLSDHSPIIVEINELTQTKNIENSLELSLRTKFNKMNSVTKDKFETLINEIINNAKKTDNLGFTENDNIERKKIIDKSEKLLIINKLIDEINE